MASVGVRYLVTDVAAAVTFYTGSLGFTVELDAAPGFAALVRESCDCCSMPSAAPVGRPR